MEGKPTPTEQPTAWVDAERRAVALAAKQYRLHLHRGDPVGRLEVPRLGLNAIVVNGTDHDSLTKGPGRYLGTYMPGEHELVYVAGHRTTYLAPFAHIDSLRLGDQVAALVVVKEIVDEVPLFQWTVALPDDEPLPQLSLPAPDAETVPLVIPATPLQVLNVPENV